MNPISKPQADLLAALAVALRPVGANPWDAAGVRNAIADARPFHDALDLAHAVLELAVNPRVRTPALLGNPGDHWRHSAKPTPVPPRFVAPPAVDDPDVARRGAAACRQALAHAGRNRP